jgi:hypothetical protein
VDQQQQQIPQSNGSDQPAFKQRVGQSDDPMDIETEKTPDAAEDTAPADAAASFLQQMDQKITHNEQGN